MKLSEFFREAEERGLEARSCGNVVLAGDITELIASLCLAPDQYVKLRFDKDGSIVADDGYTTAQAVDLISFETKPPAEAVNSTSCPGCGQDLSTECAITIVGVVSAANDIEGAARFDIVIECYHCAARFNAFVPVRDFLENRLEAGA